MNARTLQDAISQDINHNPDRPISAAREEPVSALNLAPILTLGEMMAARRERVEKVCPACRKPFVGIHIAVYCSDRCRNAAHYADRKAARAAARATEAGQ